MQKFIGITLVALLCSGLVVGYIMYKQLGTATATLAAEPELVMNEQGAECGEVEFSVDARTLGQWYFEVPKAKTISGTITVSGDEGSDVGFSIWSPANRAVVFEGERQHQMDFVVEQTIRGAYRFDFDNRHSTFSDKQVTVALCVA